MFFSRPAEMDLFLNPLQDFCFLGAVQTRTLFGENAHVLHRFGRPSTRILKTHFFENGSQCGKIQKGSPPVFVWTVNPYTFQNDDAIAPPLDLWTPQRLITTTTTTMADYILVVFSGSVWTQLFLNWCRGRRREKDCFHPCGRPLRWTMNKYKGNKQTTQLPLLMSVPVHSWSFLDLLCQVSQVLVEPSLL